MEHIIQTYYQTDITAEWVARRPPPDTFFSDVLPPLCPGATWLRPAYRQSPVFFGNHSRYRSPLDPYDLKERLRIYQKYRNEGANFRIGRYRIFTKKVLSTVKTPK